MSSEEAYLYLTTTGHKTGTPHEIEIWFVSYSDCYYLVSEKFDQSHWMVNIRYNDAITFRVGKTHFTGTARIPDYETEDELIIVVKARMDAKYGWSNGLVVELCGAPED